MKKLICYICASLGIVMAIYFVTVEHSVWLFIQQIILSIIIFIAVPIYKKKVDLNAALIISIWLACFNLIYIILKYTNIIDLFEQSYASEILYLPPMTIVLAYRLIEYVNSSKQKN